MTGTKTTRLTDADRLIIAQASLLRGVAGPAAMRRHAGETDTAMAYVTGFGEAQFLLPELVAIIERLDS